MKNPNIRDANLAKHCGNCAFHDWESESAKCINILCKDLTDDYRKTVLEQFEVMVGEDGDQTITNETWFNMVEAIAEEVQYLEADEWQEYSEVCDLWQKKKNHKEDERKYEDAIRAAIPIVADIVFKGRTKHGSEPADMECATPEDNNGSSK